MDESHTAYSGTDLLEVLAEAENYNAFLERLVRQHAVPGEMLLDFGAGIGTFAGRLTRAGHDVVAVEPDANQRGLIAGHGLRPVASLAALPSASVAYAYSLNVLEHIADDVGALRELHRVLSPGGRLMIYVPALSILWTRMDDRVGHLRRYTRRSLTSALRAAGFGVSRCRYADSLGAAAALAYRLLRRDGRLDPAAVRFYDRVLFPISRVGDIALHPVLGKNVWALAVRE